MLRLFLTRWQGEVYRTCDNISKKLYDVHVYVSTVRYRVEPEIRMSDWGRSRHLGLAFLTAVACSYHQTSAVNSFPAWRSLTFSSHPSHS